MNWHRYKYFESYVASISIDNAKSIGYLKNSNTQYFQILLIKDMGVIKKLDFYMP